MEIRREKCLQSFSKKNYNYNYKRAMLNFRIWRENPLSKINYIELPRYFYAISWLNKRNYYCFSGKGYDPWTWCLKMSQAGGEPYTNHDWL